MPRMIKRRHLDMCRCFDFESPQVPQKQGADATRDLGLEVVQPAT